MTPAPDALPDISLWQAYRLRWKRRRRLWDAFRARHALSEVSIKTHRIGARDLLAFVCLRNEMQRLPHFLDYYRARGVSHVLCVDNGSDDGSTDWLAQQPDVSVWQTDASYRASRFGVDWVNWLLTRYGTGHWCLTVDADELLVYPDEDHVDLPGLTQRLDALDRQGFGALMLDLYPEGALGTQNASPDPLGVLRWFDAQPYRASRQTPMGNLWVQGGARERVFFADTPRRSPTLNKLPLVKWRRGMVYVNSTHAMLPRKLNALYDGPSGRQPSGVILHTKFLPDIVDRSDVERGRAQHFHTPTLFGDYYDQIASQPALHHAGSVEYTGVRQLVDLGLATPLP